MTSSRRMYGVDDVKMGASTFGLSSDCSTSTSTPPRDA
jgi:hypothetical protein